MAHDPPYANDLTDENHAASVARASAVAAYALNAASGRSRPMVPALRMMSIDSQTVCLLDHSPSGNSEPAGTAPSVPRKRPEADRFTLDLSNNLAALERFTGPRVTLQRKIMSTSEATM
ncbi:MAG: hypothetical protein AB7G35_23935, partial [Hyphomicrobiaceae bacterium]